MIWFPKAGDGSPYRWKESTSYLDQCSVYGYAPVTKWLFLLVQTLGEKFAVGRNYGNGFFFQSWIVSLQFISFVFVLNPRLQQGDFGSMP